MDIVVRATIAFILVYGLLRLLGKRQLAEMTPFEFIALVMVGDLVQQAVTHSDTSLTGALLAIATFLMLSFMLSWLRWRSPGFARLIDSAPTLVVRDGCIIEGNLARDRLTADDIREDMRQAGIARIEDVALAILEPDGRISFLRQDEVPLAPGREAAGRPSP